MADAGELFVRVRPSTAGFTSEAQGPIAAAGRDLSRVFLAAFAVGGIATTITGVVKAATEHQAAYAVLEQVTKNAGAANQVFGRSLQSVLEAEARLKGFSDEQLAAAFQRIVSVTHNSEKAMRDLSAAEDLARFRHIDLASAALLLSKAEQGKFQALQRVGIVVPAVTTAEDALKLAPDRLAAAGGKLTEQDKERYTAALAAAKATDGQASAQEALAIVQQRTGGAAAVFANTAAGQFARLQQDFHQFEVSVGENLLPYLASGAEALGRWFTELQHNEGVQAEFRTAVHDIGAGLHDVATVAQTAAPLISGIADQFGGVTKALELLGASFITYKIAGSLGLVATSETAVAASGGAATASMAALTAALVANTAAQTANSAAVGEATVIYDAYGGVLATVAAEETAAAGAVSGLGAASVVASGRAAVLTGALGRLVALSPIAIAIELAIHPKFTNKFIPGIGALGDLISGHVTEGNILKLLFGTDFGVGRPQIQTQGTPAAGGVFGGGAIGQLTSGLKGAVGAQKLTISQQWAKDTADAAKAAAAAVAGDTTVSAALGAAGRSAVAALRQGISQDQTDLAALKTSMADAVTQGAQAVDAAVSQAKQNLSSIGASLAASIGTFIDKPLSDAAQRIADAQDKIALTYDSKVAPLNAAAQRLADAQDRIAATYDAKSAALDSKIRAVQAQQAAISAAGNRQTLANLGREVTLPGGRALSQDPAAALRELEALQASIARRTGAADPALAAYILQYRSASLAVTSDALQAKKTVLDNAHTVTETGLKIAGDTLKVKTDAVNATHAAATTALQLRSDALKISQDLAAHQKTAVAQRIADLTDEYASGLLTIGQLERRTVNVLVAHGVTRARAVKELGAAFADTLSGQERGIGAQAAAIAAGPRRAGTGLEPSIVRPAETLAGVTKQVAGIASQERAKQLDETKKHTELLKKIHAAQATVAFVNSLAKNPGQEAARQKHLVGVGG